MEDEQTIPEEVITEETQEVATEETQEVETPAETTEETNEQTTEEKTPEEVAKHNFEGAERRHKFKAEKQRREAAEIELQHLKEQIARNNAPAQPQPAISRDPNAPSIETFNGDTDQYVEAMIEYKAKQQTQQRATQDLVSGFDNLEREYKAVNPSYEDDIAYSNSPKPSALVAKAILKSEVGPQVLHELVKDPQLAAKLNRMEDIDAMKELIKIEDKAKVKPAVSSAPAPISSPKTSSPVGSSKISENGSQADYNRKMSHYRATGEWPQ